MRRSAAGQSLVALAALLPLVLLPLALYTVEAALLATRQARLTGAVIQAAEDGAQQIDRDSYRRNPRVSLLPGQVRAVAEASLRASDPVASLDEVSFDGQGRVRLAAHEEVPLHVAMIWPNASIRLRAETVAWLRLGYEPIR